MGDFCQKISENGPNFRGFWVWGHGIEKVMIFTAKGTSLRESTSFKLFWAKIG